MWITRRVSGNKTERQVEALTLLTHMPENRAGNENTTSAWPGKPPIPPHPLRKESVSMVNAVEHSSHHRLYPSSTFFSSPRPSRILECRDVHLCSASPYWDDYFQAQSLSHRRRRERTILISSFSVFHNLMYSISQICFSPFSFRMLCLLIVLQQQLSIKLQQRVQKMEASFHCQNGPQALGGFNVSKSIIYNYSTWVGGLRSCIQLFLISFSLPPYLYPTLNFSSRSYSYMEKTFSLCVSLSLLYIHFYYKDAGMFSLCRCILDYVS